MPRHKATSRSVALDLLDWVLERNQPLEEGLARNRDWHGLTARDRAFARLLATTALRRLGQLDAVIDACMERPLKHRQVELRNLLRLGAVQLLFLETAPHAAVSTSLDLADFRPHLSGFKGLLNAVLRRLATEGRALIANQDAARLSLPDWLWDRWAEIYGEAQTRAIADAMLKDPPLDITVKEKAETLARRMSGTAFPWNAVRIGAPRGSVTELPGFKEGHWWVQDIAASLSIRFLGPLKGKKAIDLCAAPGGKTAVLAAAGAEVTAVDRAAGRMEKLRQNLDRLEMRVRVVPSDILHWRPDSPADLVVLDAPCSATGTLRRHPDIKILKRPEDILSLIRRQGEMLRAASAMVKPGGMLLYIVCSLEREEGPDLIKSFLEERTAFNRKVILPEELFGLDELIDDEGDIRSLPCHLQAQGGIDGFYVCRMENQLK